MEIDLKKLDEIEKAVLDEFYRSNLVDTDNPDLVRQIAEIAARISTLTLAKLLGSK